MWEESGMWITWKLMQKQNESIEDDGRIWRKALLMQQKERKTEWFDGVWNNDKGREGS